LCGLKLEEAVVRSHKRRVLGKGLFGQVALDLFLVMG
jgi:hypothetical protein